MSDELVTVAGYPFVSDADAARLLLESQGIQAFLDDANLVIGLAIEAKVQVAAADAECARRILEAWDAERRQQVDSDDDDSEEAAMRPDPEPCLSCGATIPDGQTQCPACGWSYAVSEAGNQPDSGVA